MPSDRNTILVQNKMLSFASNAVALVAIFNFAEYRKACLKIPTARSLYNRFNEGVDTVARPGSYLNWLDSAKQHISYGSADVGQTLDYSGQRFENLILSGPKVEA